MSDEMSVDTGSDSGVWKAIQSLIIVPCPRCDRDVRLPPRLSDECQLRCLHCGQDFPIEELVEDLPPLLEIVDDASDGQFSDIELDDEGAIHIKPVPVPVKKTSEVRRRRHRRRSVDSATAAAASATVAKPRTGKKKRRVSTRHREIKSINRNVETLKVFLGALLALPVAQLLIWWIFQSDPMNFGRPVSRVVPIVVPTRFHDPELRLPESRPSAPAESTPTPVEPQTLPRSTLNPLDIELP